MCDMMTCTLNESHREMDISSAMKTLAFSNNFYVEEKET